MQENSLNLSYVLEKYFPPEYSPYTVNTGECYKWAYIVFKLYNNVKLYTVTEILSTFDKEKNSYSLYRAPVHAFVGVNSLYYDAEHPQGSHTIEDFHDPITEKNKIQVKQESALDFKKSWEKSLKVYGLLKRRGI